MDLTALTERRAQIRTHFNQLNAQVEENIKKYWAIHSSNHSANELKILATQREALDEELKSVTAELKRVENAIRAEDERIQDEKRKADEQAKLELDRQKQEEVKAQWTDAESKLKRKKYVDKIIDSLKVQITPSLECVEPNDVIVKTLFRFGPKGFKKALSGKNFYVQENKETAKKDAIFSKFSVQNSAGYEDDNPLTEFDRAVLGILISEYLAGNLYTTVNIIYRALIGKVGKACDGIISNKNQRDAIAQSVVKLMGTVVDFSSVAESLKEMKYTDKDGNEVILKFSNLLSADILDAKVNGQIINDVIFFKANSPLFHIADAKSQVIRYPHSLLNVPNQNNTPRIISIKKYVLRRICEIKLHSQLTPTITFDDVFTRCRMQHCPREVKRDARNIISKLFQHLQTQNFISSFDLVQQHNRFISVKFTL